MIGRWISPIPSTAGEKHCVKANSSNNISQSSVVVRNLEMLLDRRWDVKEANPIFEFTSSNTMTIPSGVDPRSAARLG